MGGDAGRLTVLAGPCVVESLELCLRVAETLREIARRHEVGFVFKASYAKANRSSVASFTGLGLDEGLRVLEQVRRECGVPVLTDVHCREEVGAAAAVADVLQIPAFLCRQTALLQAAAATGKPVNVKKGQFLPPADMRLAAEKVSAAGDGGVLLTERGTSFGYGDLVVDMRALAIMAETGWPVVYDITHSQQRPGGAETRGGREFAIPVARAAVALGVDALFFETHPDPAHGLSDRETMLPLDAIDGMLGALVALDRTRREVAHA